MAFCGGINLLYQIGEETNLHRNGLTKNTDVYLFRIFLRQTRPPE